VTASGLSGGLALAWRPRVELECFASDKNNISAWCFSNPLHRLHSLGFSHVFMAFQTKEIKGLFGILLLLLEKALKPPGYV
jgi:hypothetical protein